MLAPQGMLACQSWGGKSGRGSAQLERTVREVIRLKKACCQLSRAVYVLLVQEF